MISMTVLVVGMAALTSCGNTQTKNVTQKQALEAAQEQTEGMATVVLKDIDTQAQTVQLYDTNTEEEETFYYNGGTQVFSKNSVALVMDQLSCGEIVDVEYDSDDLVLTKVQVSKEAWEYNNVLGSNIDRQENQITVTGRNYEYDSGVAVFCDNEQQMLFDMNDTDEVTIKGIGSKVYAFIITKGHGYIRLGGQDAFLGGTIEVDQEIFQDVKQNMLLTVGEGSHTVVLKNGTMEAVEQIEVARGEEFFLDLSSYVQPAKTEGKVRFIVTPSDATLTINGKKESVNKEISLSYGNYNVTVEAEGYKEYTGILCVKENRVECQKIYVELVAEDSEDKVTSADSATVTAKPRAESTEEAGSTSIPEATEDVAAASENTISVNTPVGASVYLNGEYQGVAPLSFPKVTGEVTITLSQEGYVTKSYTVNVPAGDGDAEYSFASLVQKQG